MHFISLNQLDAAGNPVGAGFAAQVPSTEELVETEIRSALVNDCVSMLKPLSRAIITRLFGLETGVEMGIEAIGRELKLSHRGATEERDYALFQLQHLMANHPDSAYLGV